MAVPLFRITEEDLRLFHDSLERCVREIHFFDLFYHRLLEASPEARALFAETDRAAHKRKLRASLYLCLSAARDEGGARQQLARMGARHRSLGVQAAYYTWWLESLLAAVRECDPAFTPRAEVAWRTVLQPGIEAMRDAA